MPYIIEEYKAIAYRQKQIAILEGQITCQTCHAEGWRQYCDEEACIYWIECETCKNPFNLRSPDVAAYLG